MTYRQHYATRNTPQLQPVPDKVMVENYAGSYVFQVDDWTRLDRFLILGSEGGTYYASEKNLTIDNAEAVRRCITEDGSRTVNRIIEISESGRAPKNDPALFALAMCAGLGDDETKSASLAALPKVSRIGTHLFHFLEYVEGFRGWGRSLKRAVGEWYTEKQVEDLAYQVVKYQQRDGWSHRDALRLSKPRGIQGVRNDVIKWAVGKWGQVGSTPPGEKALNLIWAFERAKLVQSEKEIANLILDYGLTREMIPTKWLNSRLVWDALLQKMPMTAMIRNLGKMTDVGILKPISEASRLVFRRLNSEGYLRKSRIHPLSVLIALRTYKNGQGLRGSLTWRPVPQIIDALDEAFYLSFGNVTPTNKRLMLALDVSGSMTRQIAGMPISAREASAAMALVTARTESNYHIMGFSGELVPLDISPRQRLDDVIRTVSSISFGRTDCALPMYTALDDRMSVDSFTVYTDSETWSGKRGHPFQALQEYRERMSIPAKLVVIGMTSTGFSIADPSDAGMLDFVG